MDDFLVPSFPQTPNLALVLTQNLAGEPTWVCLLRPGPGRPWADVQAQVLQCLCEEEPAGLAGCTFTPSAPQEPISLLEGFCFPNGSGTTDFIVPEGAQWLFLMETAGLCR